MELVGRLTADAIANTVKEDRKVVNFSIAINDSYKPKGSDEVKKITTYVNCAYWRNSGVAEYLTKGTLVELYGRIGANARTNAQGEAKASLSFQVSRIKLHGKSQSGNTKPANMATSNAAGVTEPIDDLPF